jgi:aconitase B
VDDRTATGRPHARSAASRPWKAGWPNPQLLEPDADAEYAAVIEIDLADINEPIVACPNDPDDVKFLSRLPATRSMRSLSARA